MNKNIMLWTVAAALVFGPAVNLRAQEGPGEEEEIEMSEGGPGQHEMGPGMGQGRGQMGPGMKGEMGGPGKMMFKSKKIMRGGPGMGGPGFMSEEETVALIKKHDPVFAKKVEGLRQSAPAKYKMVLQMSGKMFGQARMAQDENIEKDAVRAMSLEFDSKEQSLKYDKASDADKKGIKEGLRVKLAELFDLKTKAQEYRVQHMEKEMVRLKKNLESRKANKTKIVEQRLEQMTGEGYGW